MYDEIILKLRNLHRAYVATDNAKPGQLFADAADAIEHLQKTVLRLEDELGIYDELPLVDQKEKSSE